MDLYTYRPTQRAIARKAERFLALRSVDDFVRLVAVPQHKLELKAWYPEYRELAIPKPGGKVRHIEDPSNKLKLVQQALNNHLQCVYYHIRTDAAYGFLINAWKEPSPRNIVSNAQRHLKCRSLLNMDFTDFFHQITFPVVRRIFSARPFAFDDPLIELLCRLVTYKGRLPMGAPTSPILSNYACIALDGDLLALARRNGWIFTRFADDLSFSSQHDEIAVSDIPEIRDYTRIYGFGFNEKKTILYPPDASKYVTGLKVDTQVEIPEEFLETLKDDFDRLRRLKETQQMYRALHPDDLQRFITSIEGKLRFVEYVHGKHSPVLHTLHKEYNAAMNTSLPEQMMRWTDFPYGNF